MVALGSTLSFSAQLYDRDPSDPTAQLVNPSSATLTISKDGVSVATPSISLPPSETGKLSYNYPTTDYGRYTGRWFFTMGNGSTASYVQVFNVDPSDAGALLGLSEAKRHLNIPDSEITNDPEIVDWLSAITPVVEFYVGACLPRTVVEYQEAARVIRLDVTPVISVQSIVPYLTAGISYVSGQVRVTPDGRLMLINGLPFADYGPLEITYTAGRRPMPPNVIAAVKIILSHLWETQRGSSGLPLQGDDESTIVPGWGYAVPNRALELLRPLNAGPGVG